MKKILRWKYVLPRLAILLIVVLTVRFCLDGVLRWAIITSGESALGAKVEIAELETELRQGRLTLRGLAGANPSKTFNNLAEAEEANFEIDMASLLHKRLVITDGSITGLKFDTPRETEGALEEPEETLEEEAGPSVLDPAFAAASEYGNVWVDNLSKKLEADLESTLESPRVARELEERWPAEYKQLEARVKELQVRGKEIEKGFKEVKANPLRNLERLQQLESDLRTTEKEVKSLTAKIQGLPQQIKADQQLVDAARKKDEATIRKMLKLDDLDGDQLSSYLLEEESSGYLATAVNWIKKARELTPDKPEVKRFRGVDVAYIDRPRPQWLIEKVSLSGEASIGGEPLLLVGSLTGASSHPRLFADPMQLNLTGSGAVACNMKVVVDRRGVQAIDTLTFDCPQLAIPSRTLGRPEKLAVSVAGGPAKLEGNVILKGEQLSGQILWNQSDVQLGASVGKIKDQQLQLALQESLNSLEKVEATVELSGTLEKPAWKLQSDLGPQLAVGLKSAMSGYLEARTEKLMAGVREKIDKQMAKLTEKQEAAQQQLTAKLGKNQELLAGLNALTGGGGGQQKLSLPQIGKLPFGNLKR